MFLPVSNVNTVSYKENDEEPIEKRLRELILDWLKDTTSHGIPRIVSARNIYIRILWIICFLASVSYCCYLVVLAITNYLQYQTTIAVTVVRESPSQYPAITLCNLNPFNEEKALKYMLDKAIDFPEVYCTGGNFTNTALLIACFGTDNPYKITKSIIEKLKRSISNDVLSNINPFNLGFDLANDMLISCTYNDDDCNANNFTKFWSNEYGFCYTFNRDDKASLLLTNQAGPEYGLKMELAVQPPSGTAFSYRNGIYLVVHNQSTTPINLANGIYISTGYETYVGVSRTFQNKKSKPYSNCISDLTPFSRYSQAIFSYFNDLNITYYDQDLCVNLCYQDKLIDQCECCDLITKSIRGASYCQNPDDVICMNSFKNNFSTMNTDVVCNGVCNEECNKEIFDTSISVSDFPSSSYLNFLVNVDRLKKFFPEDSSDLVQLNLFTKQSLLRFIVNYNEHIYTSVDENPSITFDSLFGNLGGQFGLFIGISILSFIEIIEIFTELIIIIIEHYSKKKN